MPEPNTAPQPGARFSRRALLRTAVGLAGALTLGLKQADAQSVTTDQGVSVSAGLPIAVMVAPFALAFWDGTRLLDATRLKADSSLCHTGARITLHSPPSTLSSGLHTVTAQFPVPDDSGTPQWTPFLAWAASPGDPGHGITFIMPIDPVDGLRLTLEIGSGPVESRLQTDCHFGIGAAQGEPQLRRGTYLLAPAETSWAGYGLSAGGNLVMKDGQPADFAHLVITVQPM